MADASSLDGVVHMTSPVPSPGLRGSSPFDVPDPRTLVFVCFFRTPQMRAQFRAALREALGRAALEPAATPSLQECAAAFEAARTQGHSLQALLAVVKWWAATSPQGIHIYNLTVEYPPFRASSLVGFHELAKEEVRANAERALDMMDEERSRVASFFQWGGQTSVEP